VASGGRVGRGSGPKMLHARCRKRADEGTDRGGSGKRNRHHGDTHRARRSCAIGARRSGGFLFGGFAGSVRVLVGGGVQNLFGAEFAHLFAAELRRPHHRQHAIGGALRTRARRIVTGCDSFVGGRRGGGHASGCFAGRRFVRELFVRELGGFGFLRLTLARALFRAL